MDLGNSLSRLLRLPPISWVTSLVRIWREVYRGMDSDPTYHPQRGEDRLAEARRIVLGEQLSEETEEDASQEAKGGQEGDSA